MTIVFFFCEQSEQRAGFSGAKRRHFRGVFGAKRRYLEILKPAKPAAARSAVNLGRILARSAAIWKFWSRRSRQRREAPLFGDCEAGKAGSCAKRRHFRGDFGAKRRYLKILKLLTSRSAIFEKKKNYRPTYSQSLNNKNKLIIYHTGVRRPPMRGGLPLKCEVTLPVKNERTFPELCSTIFIIQ